MRRSTVQWLGQVPTHWNVRRLRFLLREYNSRSVDGTEKLLSVSQYTGVSPRTKSYNGDEPDTHANSLVGYKSVDPSDLVVNIMLAWNGSMGVSRYHGIVSPAYCVYRWNDGVHPWYYHYLLRSSEYKAIMRAGSRGVVDSRLRLYTDDLYRLEVPVPPIEEQAAIVRFLDAAEGRIRRYIIAKQKLIALLEEQKQVLINQAVGGQIDAFAGRPHAAYKPSGVEWLGRVPAHWNVRRVKQVSHVQGGFAFPSSSFGNEGIPVVRMSDIERGVLCLDSAVRIPEHGCKDDYALKEGDILYGLSGSIGATGSLGNYATVKRDSVPAQLNQRVARFRPRTVQLSDTFLVYVLQDKSFYTQVLSYTSGTAQFNVSTGDIGNIFIALPPIDEQQQIVRRLRSTAARIDADIRRARREIDLLREYRTRLVADVVTGKVDVRESATSLPAADSSGPEDDLDGALDTAADKDIHELDHNR